MHPLAEPRPVALLRSRALSLPQQVALWLVRRAYDVGSAATGRTSNKIFGPCGVAEALTALDELVTCLHRSPLGMPLVGALREPRLSNEEFDLLTALAMAQHRQPAEEVVACWGWPSAADAARVSSAVTTLATNLERAQQVLPPPHDRPQMATAAVLDTVELDPRERLLVGAVRTWVCAARDREAPLPAIAAELDRNGIGAATRALDAILVHTATAAVRTVDVRCSKCGGLSPDEARVLHAVSAVQRRDRMTAFELLSSWMQPAAVRLTLPAVEGVGVALSAAFHRLPLRAWRFPELAGRSSWPPDETAPGPRVH